MSSNDAAFIPLPVRQINGCRYFGPLDKKANDPPHGSEVFVVRIPKDFSHTQLLRIFFSAGEVYDARVMVNLDRENKGYAFVRYVNPDTASRAIVYINRHRLPSKYKGRLVAMLSTDHRTLMLTGCFAVVTSEEVEMVFRDIDGSDLISVTEETEKGKTSPVFFLRFASHRGAALVLKSNWIELIPRHWGAWVYLRWAPNSEVDQRIRFKIENRLRSSSVLPQLTQNGGQTNTLPVTTQQSLREDLLEGASNVASFDSKSCNPFPRNSLSEPDRAWSAAQRLPQHNQTAAGSNQLEPESAWSMAKRLLQHNQTAAIHNPKNPVPTAGSNQLEPESVWSRAAGLLQHNQTAATYNPENPVPTAGSNRLELESAWSRAKRLLQHNETAAPYNPENPVPTAGSNQLEPESAWSKAQRQLQHNQTAAIYNPENPIPTAGSNQLEPESALSRAARLLQYNQTAAIYNPENPVPTAGSNQLGPESAWSRTARLLQYNQTAAIYNPENPVPTAGSNQLEPESVWSRAQRQLQHNQTENVQGLWNYPSTSKDSTSIQDHLTFNSSCVCGAYGPSHRRRSDENDSSAVTQDSLSPPWPGARPIRGRGNKEVPKTMRF